MEIWLRVETAAGTVIGDGPITTARYWRSTSRLDAAGEFTFEMPASDPRAALLANRRIVRCMAARGGGVAELGHGIIESIEAVPGEPSVLVVSGSDLLRELAERSVRSLAVCEQQWVYLNGGKGCVALLVPVAPYPAYDAIDKPNCYDADSGTYEEVYLQSCSDPGTPEDAVWLYVGRDDRFDRIEFTFVPGYTNSVASTLEAQYFDVASHAWVTLSISDGTASGGATFAQDGVVSFTRPANWGRYTALEAGNWFWVRLRVAYDGGMVTTDTVRLAEVRVYADQPTTNAVNQIMAYAPDTWVRSGYPATGKECYLQFEGESVLAALCAVAEQTGEHFRLAASGREIEWLSSFSPSGLRAIAAPEGIAAEANRDAVLIRSLSRRRDTQQGISRIIPVGANGLTLANTTRTAPAGYTLNAAENYIQNDAAVSAWGIVEEQVNYPDIAVQQADSATVHPELAADALFDRALEELSRRCVEQYYYELEVVKADQALRPGESIRTIYHEWVDGYHALDIDADLNILAATVQVDESGLHTVALEIATVDRQPVTDDIVLVRAIRNLQQALRATGAMRNPMLAPGDIPVGWTGGAPVRVPVGASGQVLSVSGGMPGWITLRGQATIIMPTVEVQAAPVTFFRAPEGRSLTVKEWRVHLDTAGTSDTTVRLTKNGSQIATVTVSSGSQESATTLSEALVAGDLLGCQITVAGSGAAGLTGYAVCEG